MIAFLTSHTVKAIHASQAPDGYSGKQLADNWLSATGDTGDALVVEVRPLSWLQFEQLRTLDPLAQTESMCEHGIVSLAGQRSADWREVLSQGAVFAVADLVIAVTSGPLASRQPATPTAAQ